MVAEDNGIRETINTLFDQYILEAFEVVSSIVGIGQQFAYIGMGLMALGTFLNPMTRSNIFAYLRWVPLAILLLHYRTIVITIYEFYQNLGLTFRKNDISWNHLQLKIIGAQIHAGGELGHDLITFRGLDSNVLQVLVLSGMTSGIVIIASVLSAVVFVGIKAMSVIYLFVLIVFGPLNIGLSFVPAFEGIWKAWLQKFMSVCLWVPMLYLIDSFMLTLLDKLFTEILNGGDANLGMVLTSGFLMLMNALVYLKAPMLSNLVVQGMNISASHLKDKTKHYTKKAIQTAIDAKTNGATKGVRTLMQ